MSDLLLATIVIVIIVVMLALTLLPTVRDILHRFAIGHPYMAIILERGRNAARALLLVSGAKIVLALIGGSDASWTPWVQHLLTIIVIAAVSWFLCIAVVSLEEILIVRSTLDEANGRRFITQMSLLRRVLIAIIMMIGIASILMTFPAVKAVGEGIFVSAGVISIVAGLAAQATLTNTFAGIQLALSNAIRVDDFVSVEGRQGWVEDISLHHVVLQIWDDRRVIYPTSFFINHPFENWSRSAYPITGSTRIDADWTAPLGELRGELQRFLECSPLWDGRTGELVVADATEGRIQLQINLSASSPGNLFSLQSAVREAMVTYIVRNVPEAMHRIRSEPMHSSG